MSRAPFVAREHEFEPMPGLPEVLPADERLLWQGAPDWRVLALRVFHVRKVAIYFALLLLWQGASLASDGTELATIARALGWSAALAGTCIGLLLALARWTAATTAYTLTDKRMVMRIGIVLTVAYNLPLRRIEAADLHAAGRGCHDIVLTLEPGTRIAWLHLWPHVRPWRLARPQPMLRALPDGETVAALLTRVWADANGTPARAAAAPERALGPRPVRIAAQQG